MAIRTREELMNIIKTRIGDDNSDENISFLEDVTDTLDDLENKAVSDSTDWKAKFEENDASWRKKYTERFFNPDPDIEEDEIEDVKDLENEEKPKTFEELFKEE